MSDNVKQTLVNLIPTMRYNDAAAAITWLCEAFAFEEQLRVPGDNSSIVHAQLVFGNGMIMLGSARDDELGQLQKPPSETAGVGTQSVYVVVGNVDRHHVRALAAGAEITTEPMNPEHGGRFYSCRDPEGHVWHFGSYDPWLSV